MLRRRRRGQLADMRATVRSVIETNVGVSSSARSSATASLAPTRLAPWARRTTRELLIAEKVLQRANKSRILREPSERSRRSARNLERQLAPNDVEFRARFRMCSLLALGVSTSLALSLLGQLPMKRFRVNTLAREVTRVLALFRLLFSAKCKFGTKPCRLRRCSMLHSGGKRLDLRRIETMGAVLVYGWKELDSLQPADRGDALTDPLRDLRPSQRPHAHQRERGLLDRQGCEDFI